MFAPPVAKAKTTTSSDDKTALRRATPFGHRHGAGNVEHLLMLQRSIGNQAVLQLLRQRSLLKNGYDDPEQGSDQAGMGAREGPVRGAWDLGNGLLPPPGRVGGHRLPSALPAPRLPGFIQAKLKVGDVDDPLEREADRVAEQVMRMPAPSVSIAAASRQIGRKCADCEQEEKLQTKPVRPQAAAGEAPASVYEVLRSPGQSLDAPTRAYFESRFGHDFSRVRVHTGTTAEGSAQEVNANAYTVGHNIAFGSGRFAPETHEGRQLLAHELTHVVQQSGGEIPHLIRRQGPQAPGCPALNVTIGQGQCGANYGATATYCFTGGFANNTQVWFRENVAELLGAEVKCQPGVVIGQAPAPGQSRTRDNCFRDQIINSNGPPSKVAPCWDGTYQTLSVGPTQNSVGQCAYTQNQIIEVTTTRKDGRGNSIAGEVITNAGQEKTKCNWP